jgi:hypothetical protein
MPVKVLCHYNLPARPTIFLIEATLPIRLFFRSAI